MSFNIENPIGMGKKWKVLEDENALRVVNPNNVLRGIVTVDEDGVHVEGPIADEGRDEVVERITELIDMKLSEQEAA